MKRGKLGELGGRSKTEGDAVEERGCGRCVVGTQMENHSETFSNLLKKEKDQKNSHLNYCIKIIPGKNI